MLMQGGPPQPETSNSAYGPESDPLDSVKQCLNDLHKLMTALPDAQHTALVHQAMGPLLKIQSDLTAAQQPSPLQARLQASSG